MLPPAVIRQVCAHFDGARVLEEREATGGYSHLASHLALEGAQCFVKAEAVAAKRIELAREAQVLRLLSGSGLPVPKLIAFLESTDWSVTLLEDMGGQAGSTLFGGSPDAIARAYAALARALRTTHAVHLDAASAAELSLAERVARTRERLAHFELEQDLRQTLDAALSHAVWRDPGGGLLHGDPGLHNVLWENGALTALLDWEWAGWGPPVFDLAWLHWTMQLRHISSVWPVARAAYDLARSPRLSEDAVIACQLSQIGMILDRSRETPHAFAEWQRRLTWTLERQRLPSWLANPA